MVLITVPTIAKHFIEFGNVGAVQGGRSVGIVRLRTKGRKFVCLFGDAVQISRICMAASSCGLARNLLGFIKGKNRGTDALWLSS
jgi:hypothetical protein